MDRITEACKKHEVKSLYLFGSAATGHYTNNSDIDFIVEYARNKEGLSATRFDYFDFLFLREDITGRKVDLVIADAIRNKYFKESIEKGKLLLYPE